MTPTYTQAFALFGIDPSLDATRGRIAACGNGRRTAPKGLFERYAGLKEMAFAYAASRPGWRPVSRDPKLPTYVFGGAATITSSTPRRITRDVVLGELHYQRLVDNHLAMGYQLHEAELRARFQANSDELRQEMSNRRYDEQEREAIVLGRR